MATKPSTTKQSDNDEEAASMKFDVVGHLPLEIAQKILFQLSAEDLHSAASCCLGWKAVLSCELLWKRLCRREGYVEVEEPKRSEFYTNLLKKYNYWEGVFWYNHTLRRNWEANNCSEVIFEIGYADNSWLFEEAFVYTTEDNTKLNVYYFNSKEITTHVFQLDDYFDGSLLTSGKYLISFTQSFKLIVWNLENGSTIHHKHKAYDFHVYKNLILLPILYKKFEVFNIETEQIEYCFPFEPGTMNCDTIFFMDGRIIFITNDNVIHILNWEDKSLVTITCCDESKKMEDHKIMVKKDILFSFCNRHHGDGVYNTFLCVWNTTTRTKLHSTLLNYSVESVSLIKEYICFMNYCYQEEELFDIVLWDYMKRTEEATLNCELKLYAPDIYASNDHVMIVPQLSTIKMWCLSKKDYNCELNFISGDCTYCEIEISKTKLICAISHKESQHIIKLYVRNFEI